MITHARMFSCCIMQTRIMYCIIRTRIMCCMMQTRIVCCIIQTRILYYAATHVMSVHTHGAVVLEAAGGSWRGVDKC
jgi:hypothetical protein